MRLLLVAALCALAAVPALAQTTNPPGYTPLDVAQQAKLGAHVGTWQCVSVPGGAPVSSTETEQGNWFVTRRTGAAPATSYERWSHTLKAYILLEIFDSGASNVSETTSLDPDNATYTQMWPALDDQGRKRFDFVVSRTGNVIRSTFRFYDEKGTIRNGASTCTKQ
ncbi:MAG TPA: hypothetical protein VKR56_15090 [Candidatus Cybelea sp.]|nr:hypothetical protein [Candidatus Cybelea sp.]